MSVIAVQRRTYINRFKRLIKFLRELPPEKFDYGTYGRNPVHGCDTVACAVGWMPVVDPRNWHRFENMPRLRKTRWSIRDDGRQYFGISDESYEELFIPDYPNVSSRCPLRESASAKEVADHLEQFITTRSKEIAGKAR